MTVTCADFDRILESEDPELRSLLEAHAAGCADCRERLELWDMISAAAPLLRETWNSPGLWTRIETDLDRERPSVRDAGPALRPARGRAPGARGAWRGIVSRAFSPRGLWLAAAAAALLVILPLALNERHRPRSDGDASRPLLTEQALDDVRRNEEAYERSIEKLADLAGPALSKSESHLAMNYREKLQLLDAAIAECRAQADLNPFNAHLRAELLSMYREKQRTLETVLKETPSDL